MHIKHLYLTAPPTESVYDPVATEIRHMNGSGLSDLYV